uniref:Secreted protein n=1 Tax=Rhizophora mucronata TaxID=61149 RepID=A0A2P2QCV4_RHIMU
MKLLFSFLILSCTNCFLSVKNFRHYFCCTFLQKEQNTVSCSEQLHQLCYHRIWVTQSYELKDYTLSKGRFYA